jgi:hypothetical protein
MRLDDLREIRFSSSPTQLLDVFAGVALSGLLLAFVLRVDRLTAVYAAVAAAAASWGISWVRSTADRIGCAFSDARVNVPSACRCPLSRPAARRKFVDQAWQLAIHVSCFLWEASLLWRNAEWWTDPNTCFQPCPADVTFGAELRAFYVFQLVLWMWTAVSCQWLEERRQDYAEMICHHVITVALVLGSLLANEVAIGLVVLFVHDSSDILLDLMKMSNYLKLQDRHGWFASETLFVLNYISWIYLRLYVFPMYVIDAVAYDDYATRCSPDGTEFPGTTPWSGILLHLLLVLHCFWFAVLTRIAVRIVRGQAADEAGDEEYEVVRPATAAMGRNVIE